MGFKKIGKQTVEFENSVSIHAFASIVGKQEGEGPLSGYFSRIIEDPYCGEETWEKGEQSILTQTVKLVMEKAKLKEADIDFLLGGDLINQCVPTNFMAREISIPFLGLYGACSTMAEGLLISSMIIDGGFAKKVIATASSHFCSAERQYRNPMEQGGQRPMYAQWTVTGSGACMLSSENKAPYITHATIGKIVDLGIKDANNMGAAMAPAAAQTITQHFQDTGRKMDYYDLIITGDLGYYGLEILKELLKETNTVPETISDCGAIIYDREKQDMHGGGSGCGCSASVLNGYLLEQMKLKKLNKILFVATGALLSPISSQQGESIPCIAHAIAIENERSIV